ncbi:MAG: hypothetical protein GPJ54_04395 [Candidatus Heimdallarchaeota archaeon]|nr:hypothetical protein [Candidatus Heimdallarchaeota archaeon]
MELVTSIEPQGVNNDVKGPITLLGLILADFYSMLILINFIFLRFNIHLIDFTELFIIPGIHGFRPIDFIWIAVAIISLYMNLVWTTYLNWRKIDRYFIIISMLIALYLYLWYFTYTFH